MNKLRPAEGLFYGKDAIMERDKLIGYLKLAGVPENDVQSIRRKFPVVNGKWRVPEYEELVAAAMRVDYHPDIIDGLLAYEYPDEFGKR